MGPRIKETDRQLFHDAKQILTHLIEHAGRDDGNQLGKSEGRKKTRCINGDHDPQHPHKTAEIRVFLTDVRDDVVVDDRGEQIGRHHTGQRRQDDEDDGGNKRQSVVLTDIGKTIAYRA